MLQSDSGTEWQVIGRRAGYYRTDGCACARGDGAGAGGVVDSAGVAEHERTFRRRLLRTLRVL